MERYFKPPLHDFSPGSTETRNVGQAWKEWKQPFEKGLLCDMGPAYIKVFNKFTFTNNDQRKH